MLNIFDVDNTILNTSTVKDTMLFCIKIGVMPAAVLLYAPYYFILFAIFGVREQFFNKPRGLLKGLSEKELYSAASQIYESRFKKELFPEIIELINTMKSENKEVAIASSSFNFIIKPLADDLEIKHVICTELEFSNGISTGRIKGLPAFQEAKLFRVVEYLDTMNINPSDCSFYTDSYRDLSLLKGIGRPVAVNPDRRLRKLAEKNRWEIIEVKKSERRKSWQIS